MKKLIILFIAFIWMTSCKKDVLITDSSAKLDFSTDTVMFDTVFVTMGSTNHQFLVYNNNNQRINISHIKLVGANASYFRINVNGISGKEFTNMEIPDKDSLWIFVEVTINPNSGVLPFIIDDSIMFETNGNVQYVKLVAWGQNAHFFRPTNFVAGLPPYSIIPCINDNADWDATLPYVIYGYAVVDSGCTLNIAEGTKVYFYNNSGLWIYQGATIHVNGTLDKPVTFKGTRLETYYDDVPGQWDRIWINEGSINNTFDYAVIKNAFIGLQVQPIIDYNLPKNISIKNTKILNMTGVGIYAVNYNIDATNVVVGNCGAYGIACTMGGSYSFTHCTLANYWSNSQRGTPSIYLNNFYIDKNDVAQPADLTQCDFKNCILWGNQDQEIETEMVAGGLQNYQFNKSLIKVKNDYDVSDATHYINIYKNTDPGFVDYSAGNYQLDTLAFPIDKGDAAFATGNALLDILGIDRSTYAPPDLGAYERKK